MVRLKCQCLRHVSVMCFLLTQLGQMDVQVTWKNIISLGDSNFERYGTMAAGKVRPRGSQRGVGEVPAACCIRSIWSASLKEGKS
eukprot:412530-Amphidinium_carterae.1